MSRHIISNNADVYVILVSMTECGDQIIKELFNKKTNEIYGFHSIVIESTPNNSKHKTSCSPIVHAILPFPHTLLSSATLPGKMEILIDIIENKLGNRGLIFACG